MPHVRLRGAAHIEVREARQAGEVLLSGTVVDDAARPVVGTRVGLTLARAADPRHPIGLAATRPQSCDASGPDPELQGDDRILLTADEGSRFCVALVLSSDRYVAHVETRASAFVDGAATDLAFDLALSPVTIHFTTAFTAAPTTALTTALTTAHAAVSLDDETTGVSVVASIEPPTEGPGVAAPAAGLVLSLSNEVGAQLGSATTDRSGLARFAVAAAHLGRPGPGEIRVSFAGDARAGPASETIRVERRARVEIAAPEATSGRLPAAWPEDGIGLRVTASLPCARHGCLGPARPTGDWPGGMIEARIAPAGVVGAAPVVKGEGRLWLTFAAPSTGKTPDLAVGEAPSGDVRITVAYIPDAPWFQAGSDLVLALPVRGPSPWRKWPLVLAAAAVVAWLALARSSGRPRVRRAVTRGGAPLAPAAGIALVRADARAKGWTGRVTDAHEGVAVPFARVSIERRDFERVHVVAETTAGASGDFILGHVEPRAGDELVVDGPRHARIRRALPASGELAVALALRKRALLDRLAGWARRQGPPYGMLPDASPGHVRRAAGPEAAVAQWATAVEQAAYGDAAVDERAEADIDRLAPPGARGTGRGTGT